MKLAEKKERLVMQMVRTAHLGARLFNTKKKALFFDLNLE
jgi:hypothetical protein